MTGLPSELREAIAAELNGHHPTRGMAVAMGVTCECGYWTHSEPEDGKRPLPWGRDRLDLHRADVVTALLAQAWDAGYDAPRQQTFTGGSGSMAVIAVPIPRRNPWRNPQPDGT